MSLVSSVEVIDKIYFMKNWIFFPDSKELRNNHPGHCHSDCSINEIAMHFGLTQKEKWIIETIDEIFLEKSRMMDEQGKLLSFREKWDEKIKEMKKEMPVIARDVSLAIDTLKNFEESIKDLELKLDRKRIEYYKVKR